MGFIVRVYQMADFCLFPELKAFASVQFEERVSGGWEKRDIFNAKIFI